MYVQILAFSAYQAPIAKIKTRHFDDCNQKRSNDSFTDEKQKLN